MSPFSAAFNWSQPAPALVTAFEASATRTSTPCGDGAMIWRRWGEPDCSKPPVVLLHGGSGSWTHWIKVIPALASQTEVWAPDLPGLGDSAMPDQPYTPENAGHILAAGMRTILAEGQRPHLVAFSFGAHVGTFAAADLGQQLSTFTICGCAALGIPHNRLEFERERSSMTAAERDAVHRTNLERLMIANRSNIDALAVYLHGENIRRARFKSRAFAATDEIPANLPRVTAPVHAIWGALDVLATPSVEARYDILRRHHPELQTRTIPDAGHWVAYEQPRLFVEALASLLQLQIDTP